MYVLLFSHVPLFIQSLYRLSLRNHPTTADAIKEIKEHGYKIYASDLNPNSKDVRDINWDDGPYCIVMGNEDKGISEEMRNLADETFTLPMCGFAESFNLSVATSITLAHMSAKSQNGNGPLKPGDMSEHEFDCLYLKGLLHSLPQRRTGQAILRQNNMPEVLKVFETL
jgi:tRNA C32,U32 (ribose-2'-O)-methylase TrmJ